MYVCEGAPTVPGQAVGTGGQLPALLVDLLGDGLPGSGRESGSLHQVQERLTVDWRQQNPAACLHEGEKRKDVHISLFS